MNILLHKRRNLGTGMVWTVSVACGHFPARKKELLRKCINETHTYVSDKMAASRRLSDGQVEKALSVIRYLSSLNVPAG